MNRTLLRAWLALSLLLLVSAYVLSAAMNTPPSWSLQIGAPDALRFSSGFYLAEQSAGAPFRWAGPGAHVMLHAADLAPAALGLRLNGDQLARASSPTLALAPDWPTQVPTTTFAVSPGWRLYHVLLPPQDAGTNAPGLTFVSDTARPGPGDGRDLGVAVSAIRVRPLFSGTWLLNAWPLHPRALALVWALGLVAAALLLIGRWTMDRGRSPDDGRWTTDDGRSPDDDPRSTVNGQRSMVNRPRSMVNGQPSTVNGQWSTVISALTLVPVATAALTIWARRNPTGLAFVLPPMPWTLGLASVALAALAITGRRRATLPLAPAAMRRNLWAALGLLAAGQVLLYAQVQIGVGIALALGGMALLAVADDGLTPHPLPPLPQGERGNTAFQRGALRWERMVLLAIFLLALVLRCWDLGGLPFGLWRDEARHGMVALRILDDPSYRPIYVAEGGVNMPALMFYPFALAIKLWGIHPWSMRPLTALAGALTVLPLYGLVRRLWGGPAALLAAAFLAVSAWHITVSRFSFPTVFDPLFGLTALWLIVWAFQSSRSETRRLWALLLAGVCLGLAVQTYHTGRVVPAVAAVLFAGLCLDAALAGGLPRRVLVRHIALRALAVALGLIVVAGPMLWYALRQQASFNDRVSGVFLLSEDALQGRAPLAALDDTLRRHLLLFNVRGDENGRHAPPGTAALDFITGLGFLAGCGLILAGVRRPRDWRGPFLLLAIAISVVPSALAVDAPHGMRSVGACAFACVIAALGATGVLRRLAPNARTARPLLRFAPLALVAGLALVLNTYTYFFWMATNPNVWMSFYPVHTQMGAYVRALHERGEDQGRQVFVAAGIATNPVFVYLTDGINVQTYQDGTISEPLRPGALFLLSGYVYERDRVALTPYLAEGAAPVLSGPPFPGRAIPSFLEYNGR